MSSTATVRAMRWRFGAPIFALVIAAMAGALAVFSNFARQQDEAFVRQSAQLVESAVRGRVRALANTTLDYAIWDEAFQNVTAAPDPAWMSGNLYSSAVDAVIVFRADRAVRYAWFADDVPAPVRAAASRLTQSAGAPEDLAAAAQAGEPARALRQAWALAGEDLILMAAAPVSPEDAAARQAARAGPVDYLLSADVLGQSELAQIGETLGLQGLAFTPGAGASADEVSLPLRDTRGAAIAHLVWRNEQPGSAAFAGQVWPIIGIGLFLGLGAAFVASALIAHQMRAIAQAETENEANRSKSETIALLANELRAPLNAMFANARLMQTRIRDGARDTAALGAEADRIAAAARRMLEQIDRMVDEAQIDAGHFRPAVERVDVERAAREAADAAARAARARGLAIEVFADADAGLASADRMRLTQCVLALFWSAIRVAQSGALNLHVMRRAGADGQDFIAFDLAIPGADAAALQALFETQKGSAPLSLARKLARAMGGDLTIGAAGRGAMLTLTAPACADGARRAA